MHRFYLFQAITGSTTSITDTEQLHHLRDVLRLKNKDEVNVFDSEGTEFFCRINSLDRKAAVLNIISRKAAKPEKIKITIACAIPKNARMDEIIDKLTQLGVDTIIPLKTERVIVKMDENQESRLIRWRKIALNASEQSQRNNLPIITPLMNLGDLLD